VVVSWELHRGLDRARIRHRQHEGCTRLVATLVNRGEDRVVTYHRFEVKNYLVCLLKFSVSQPRFQPLLTVLSHWFRSPRQDCHEAFFRQPCRPCLILPQNCPNAVTILAIIPQNSETTSSSQSSLKIDLAGAMSWSIALEAEFKHTYRHWDSFADLLASD
jgi:hypothetical protein